MDDKEYGMDPAVRMYFKKIIRSFIAGLFWMIIMVVAGLYFGAALIEDEIKWYNVIFYLFFAASLSWLIRFFYKCWKN